MNMVIDVWVLAIISEDKALLEKLVNWAEKRGMKVKLTPLIEHVEKEKEEKPKEAP